MDTRQRNQKSRPSIGRIVDAMGAAAFGLLAAAALYGAVTRGAHIHWLTAAMSISLLLAIARGEPDEESSTPKRHRP